ncbi:MAG: ABC transporter ATP-binding protein [Kiritimatiellae bacterium]|jgi:iron complex transport system ATP-binding protein|nr:ABC transporter ATP-binding protein [Kiritimatiellia bacterium]
MIKLHDIGVFYEEEMALSHITLTIKKGEMAGIIGANGAGKSTLLKVISGALKAEGKALIEGREINSLSATERASVIAVVPQEIPSEIPLRGYEFVMLGRTHRLPRFGAPGATDVAAVRKAMISTGTEPLKERFLSDMSGGERQRLALAMAFAAGPRIILLDEATAHLDMHHRVEIMHLLREMNRSQGVTVLMAVHDLMLAGRFFDRLILLENGSILKDGTPQTVLQASILEQAYGCRIRTIPLPDDLGMCIVPE